MKNSWQPIEDLPAKFKTSREMFVVKAIKVNFENVKSYTSDPYCVWYDKHNGNFLRWPHPFKPTHFCELPE